LQHITESIMPRVKKSRKAGPIGIANSTDKFGSHKTKSKTPSAVKKDNGRPAGSRNSAPTTNKKVINAPKKDPRIGSTKKIDLTANKQKVIQPKVKRYSTPAQELAALEIDERLAILIDKYDDDQRLTKEEMQYMEDKMARHQVLCDLLGIKDDDDESEDDYKPAQKEIIADDDPLKTFESININDFK
jgi:ribosome assembly protein YihI (activator of Der GTPase)